MEAGPISTSVRVRELTPSAPMKAKARADLDLIDLTDIDGRYFVKDRVTMVKAKPAGAWQEYRSANPVSKRIEPKAMYCEKLGETAVCGAVYQ